MSQAGRLRAEQEHHLKAFEMYYAQGEKRSLVRLAAQMGIAVATAKSWARSFGWRKRMAERDASIARQVADEAISSASQTQSRSRKLIELATNRLAKAMLNGQIKYQLADLERLIRLQAFLDAEANRVDGRTPEEMLEQFLEYYRTLPPEQRRRLIESTRRRESGLEDPYPRRVTSGPLALSGPIEGGVPAVDEGIPE